MGDSGITTRFCGRFWRGTAAKRGSELGWGEEISDNGVFGFTVFFFFFFVTTCGVATTAAEAARPAAAAADFADVLALRLTPAAAVVVVVAAAFAVFRFVFDAAAFAGFLACFAAAVGFFFFWAPAFFFAAGLVRARDEVLAAGESPRSFSLLTLTPLSCHQGVGDFRARELRRGMTDCWK